MKRTIVSILAILILLTGLSGCSYDRSQPEGQGLKIVSTIFPPYDWIRNILGEMAGETELSYLFDMGVDLHSYQPSADDIIKISTSDVFVYVGGESSGWVEDVLKNALNKKMVVIDLIEVLEDAVKEEEIKEGMDHHHEDESHHHEDHHHDGEVVWDEHVWLSLKNAQRIVPYLAERLGELDSDNGEYYKKNAEDYVKSLDALDALYRQEVETATFDTLIFGDRFPFRYLLDDYQLNYYAAFSGCSAETEASFETIVFLANKLDELGLGCIMTIESSNQSVAKAVIRATTGKDYKILTLDSLQSVTAADIKAGVTYLSIMESNLEILKEALN